MNLNYIGSVAERFAKFKSTVVNTETIDLNIFNGVSIYIPKSLATDNLDASVYTASEVTATNYVVITATVDNYKTIMKSSGALFNQCKDIFNDDTNTDCVLYLIVFDDTSFSVTTTATSIEWSPLTKAFNELFFISSFKMLFDTDYTGITDDDVNNYYDMALCLSFLCANEPLSTCLTQVNLTIPTADSDTNACKVLSQERGTETTHCTTLVGSDAEDRAQYFWGFLNLLGGKRTLLIVHNGRFMFGSILGKWFERKNDSGQYVGNKLAKIRLSGNGIKPSGLPSKINSDVNLNLLPKWTDNLDAKHVGYFISISDNTENDVELVSDRTIENYPVTANLISAWIDYNASQKLANMMTANETLTDPLLANEETYARIQQLVQSTLNTFTRRLSSITLKFPPYAEAKVGNTFKGVAVWGATYLDDLGGVEMSGAISF